MIESGMLTAATRVERTLSRNTKIDQDCEQRAEAALTDEAVA